MTNFTRLGALRRSAFALLLVPAAAWAQTQQLERGLDGLYATARQHNATLAATAAAIREADAAIESAKTARLPEVSGQVSVSYLGNARLWNRHFGESTKAAMPHFGNNFLLRAEQVVYAGGAIDGSIRLAQQAAQGERLTAQSEEQKVRFLLAGLYLQLHALRHTETVYRTNAALAEEQMTLMQKRRAQGTALRNDITRRELQREQMLLGEQEARDQQRIVERQLRTALGSDSLALVLLSEEAFDENAVALETEAAWQQRAVQQSLALQQADLAVDMSRTKERLEKAERRPKVALIAEDHLDGPITIEVPPIDKNLNYWFVGVGVTYNFSSLYKNKRRVQQARLATALAERRQTVASEGVADAVHAAYVSLGTARTRLATRQKSVQLAAENYTVVSRRYDNGLALITDLTDAANMKLEAELQLATARIDLLYALYNLRYVCGNL